MPTQRSIKAHEERKLARKFRETMRKIASRVVLKEAAEENPEHVMEALSIDGGSMKDVLEQIREIYMAGGDTIKQYEFDITGDEAAQWLKDHGAKLVERITQQQRDAIVEIINAGNQLGRSPKEIAKDIAGRKQKNGQRRGGIVGLNDNQAQYVANARAELRGDRPSYGYFERKRRDKSFDTAIKKYLEAGAIVPKDITDKAVAGYADKLLITRSQTIAQTETQEAYGAGQHQALKQAVAKGKADQVVRVWRSINDDVTRHTHESMDGQEVGLDDPFVDDEGNQYMYPGDSSLGAPAGQVINCRCLVTTTHKPLGVRGA